MAESLTQLADAVTARFPKGVLARVEVRPAPPEAGASAMEVCLIPAVGSDQDRPARHFMQTHRQLVEDLLAALPALSQGLVNRLSIVNPGGGRSIVLRLAGDGALEHDLTPVMTRLDSADLQTLDDLVAAGIAGSRADALRWAVARIRERPAYRDLKQRIAELERLKQEL